MCVNLSTSASSGTPYWSVREIAVANESIRPEIVEPSFDMVRKISPGCAVVVQAHGDVALVAGHVELVRDRAALVRQLPADGLRRGGLSDVLEARPLLGGLGVALRRRRVQRLRALAAVAVDRDRLQALLPALHVDRGDLVGRRVGGRLTVFEIAPERNGCTAPIIRTWPM